jgi:hypothetical protein
VNPSSIFVSSSPTKGTIVDNDEEFLLRWGWIGDTRYGSVHHYDYMSDCENFRNYPTAKFVTEFGENFTLQRCEHEKVITLRCTVCGNFSNGAGYTCMYMRGTAVHLAIDTAALHFTSGMPMVHLLMQGGGIDVPAGSFFLHACHTAAVQVHSPLRRLD